MFSAQSIYKWNGSVECLNTNKNARAINIPIHYTVQRSLQSWSVYVTVANVMTPHLFSLVLITWLPLFSAIQIPVSMYGRTGTGTGSCLHQHTFYTCLRQYIIYSCLRQYIIYSSLRQYIIYSCLRQYIYSLLFTSVYNLLLLTSVYNLLLLTSVYNLLLLTSAYILLMLGSIYFLSTSTLFLFSANSSYLLYHLKPWTVVF